MEIRLLDHHNKSDWDKFCLASDDAWFWHTFNWIQYSLNYYPKAKPVNHSFFVRENKKDIAICPLFLEQDQNQQPVFSFGSGFLPAPCLENNLTPKKRQKIFNYIFNYINILAQKYNTKLIKTRIPPLSPNYFKNICYNNLLEYGYLPCDYNTQIIDLSIGLNRLQKNIRENHRRNIKKYSHEFSLVVFHKKNITEKIFKSYQNMHRLAAGRITRPNKTFQLMLDAIKQGNGSLFAIKSKKNIIGYYLINIYKKNAYYSSAAVRPDYDEHGVGHVAHWEIIKYLNKNNFHYYEIGWQEYSDTWLEQIDNKRKNISLFKSGFGGFPKTCFQGIKFYHQDYIKKIII